MDVLKSMLSLLGVGSANAIQDTLLHISARDTSTEAYPSYNSNESRLPLVIASLRETSATPSLSPGHASVTDGTPLPNLKQPTMNPKNCVIIMQNNYIAEGGTINIFSSQCNGSTVTKLEHVVSAAESTPLEPPLVRQPEPLEHGPESIVLSGNTFGECVMINVGSPDCTGAVKQTAFASQVNPI